MFERGEFFRVDIIYRWIDRGGRAALYFYFSEIMHVHCSQQEAFHWGGVQLYTADGPEGQIFLLL